MSARNENLRRIERMRVTLTDYHRWLDHEFPTVGRVLENLYIELTSQPMHGGADVSSFRSISNLREELRRMRASGVAPTAVTDDMALAFHRAITDGPIGSDEVEDIKIGLRAVLAAVGVPGIEQMHPFWCHEQSHDRPRCATQCAECVECDAAAGVKTPDGGQPR